ncbi:MAG: hypothetical protein AB4050_00455 [Synechococcus sp.]
MTTFAARVAKANQQLRASKAKVTIFICGDRLWLQARLYPRPGTKRYRDNPNKKNQEAIAAGCECNKIGLNSVIRKARLFALQVQTGEFDWADWVKSPVRKQKRTIEAWVESFEADYFTYRQRTYQSKTTWEKL